MLECGRGRTNVSHFRKLIFDRFNGNFHMKQTPMLAVIISCLYASDDVHVYVSCTVIQIRCLCGVYWSKQNIKGAYAFVSQRQHY